jgi:hypothetical protein
LPRPRPLSISQWHKVQGARRKEKIHFPLIDEISCLLINARLSKYSESIATNRGSRFLFKILLPAMQGILEISFDGGCELRVAGYGVRGRSFQVKGSGYGNFVPYTGDRLPTLGYLTLILYNFVSPEASNQKPVSSTDFIRIIALPFDLILDLT